MRNSNLRFVVVSRLLAVVCFMAEVYLAGSLVENWDHYGIMRKIVRILACMAWAWMAYDAYALRFGWLRRFVESPK